MIRLASVCALCLSFAALVGAATYDATPASQKPMLIIVHSDSCAPCRVFDKVYEIDPSFRCALNEAFDLKSLDWDVPSQRADAIALGVDRMPTYIVLRGNRRVAVHRGFAMSMNAAEVDRAIADLCNSLHVEWPRPDRSRVNRAPAQPQQERTREVAPESPRVIPGPTVDQVARDGITKLASESRELQQAQQRTERAVQGLQSDVESVRSQVSESREILSQQLKESHESTRSEISTITERLTESMERSIFGEESKQSSTVPVAPAPGRPVDESNISTEIKAGPTASKWLAVLAWAGRTGLAIAAPEVALPGSALLTAAGFAVQMMRRRRAARQPAPLGHSSNPIVISEAGPVRTETKFVRTETDVLGESFAEAIRRVGNHHRESQPYIVDVLQQVDAVARQLAHGQRVVRRPANEPTSETSP
jgi:hypothetical protein